MGWRASAVLVVVLALSLGRTADARKLRVQSNSGGYDYFYFVRQWPGTFCSSHACPLLRHRDWERFTIHGLWPNRNDGTWPEFCDNTKPFDAEAIDDLEDELDKVWPSYMDSQDSEEFWAHEWNKHGTCALSELPSEHKFFKSVLKLNYKYLLEVALHKARIRPSTTPYAKSEVLGAIRDLYGVDALIHCTPDGHLSEVWMCFDKELQPMNCKAPGGYQEQCAHIIIPPIPGSHQGSDAEEADPEQGHHHHHHHHHHKKVHHHHDEHDHEDKDGEEEEHHHKSKHHKHKHKSVDGAPAAEGQAALAGTESVGAVQAGVSATVQPDKGGVEEHEEGEGGEHEEHHEHDKDGDDDDDDEDDASHEGRGDEEDDKENDEDHEHDQEDEDEDHAQGPDGREGERDHEEDVEAVAKPATGAAEVAGQGSTMQGAAGGGGAAAAAGGQQAAGGAESVGSAGDHGRSDLHASAVSRMLCIMGAGSLVGVIIIMTVISSWARRLNAQQAVAAGAAVGGVPLVIPAAAAQKHAVPAAPESPVAVEEAEEGFCDAPETEAELQQPLLRS